MRFIILSVIIIMAICYNTLSQNDTIISKRENAIKIFIQDESSDMDFIKRELTFVNYVRDRLEADVFILSSLQNTGAGGVEHRLYFIGQKDFTGKNDTMLYVTLPDATPDEIRKKNLQIIKIGLIPFIAKTPLINKISIGYESPETEEEVKDKWNNWVFDITSDLWLNGDETYQYFNNNSGINASRITENWKIEADINYYFSKNKYDTGDTILISENKSTWGSLLIVKSLTSHWSTGISGSCNSSIYNNLDFSYSFSPAIEYNIFPYSESARKQIRIKYNLGFDRNYYTDTTIFNKTEETLWSESLGIAFKTIQKWGSISISVSGEHYLHDFSKNSLYASSEINLKIVKGLSFNLSGSYYFIHNQMSIRKEEVSVEEILLRQHQLATSFSYYCNAGLQYTFGSIYNNVVNPRFGN